MTAVDDAARMLTLVPWLLEHSGATIAEAASAMGATERQIERDLDRLNFCGLPGLRGGDLMDVIRYGDRVVIHLADELRRPLKPTPGETVRLLLAAETVMAASNDPPAPLVSALAKLRAAAGIPQDAVQTVVDDSPWLEQLRAVVAGTTCVELDYQGRDDAQPRTRMVDPWRLELNDGHWYLHGRDVTIDDGRVFRLDRISGVVATDRPRGRVPDDVASPAYEPEDEELVEVVASREARWLATIFDGVEVAESDDGLVLRFGTDAVGHVATQVARAGGAARAIAPPELVRLVHDHALRALAAHSGHSRN